ncbi:hypothetical protein GCM10023322_50430 [Rugosimonospora acidiphila]|uniref:HTH tetR-type domain-containing protein n=1 Tax=Rugosimonospora acidiphila TaxID=556531 RepID=A0ABP9S6C0_9ACTN
MVRREPLNREKVLTAALALAGEEGLEGLSMRRLAKALGVEAMSLYNHVANKSDILDGIANRVLAEVRPADPALPWAERIRVTALGMYQALRRHPVVPLSLATDQANPATTQALRPLDDLVGALYEAGFDDAGVRQALGGVSGLVFGSILLSTAGFARPPAPGDVEHHEQWDEYARRIDPDELPHFNRLVTGNRDADPEEDFVRALDILIAGLIASTPSRT